METTKLPENFSTSCCDVNASCCPMQMQTNWKPFDLTPKTQYKVGEFLVLVFLGSFHFLVVMLAANLLVSLILDTYTEESKIRQKCKAALNRIPRWRARLETFCNSVSGLDISMWRIVLQKDLEDMKLPLDHDDNQSLKFRVEDLFEIVDRPDWIPQAVPDPYMATFRFRYRDLCKKSAEKSTSED